MKKNKKSQKQKFNMYILELCKNCANKCKIYTVSKSAKAYCPYFLKNN